jgi:hypothetical protein
MEKYGNLKEEDNEWQLLLQLNAIT